MQRISVYLLLLCTIFGAVRQTSAQENFTITRNLTIEVAEDSVGLWKIWQDNRALLSKRFKGFIKYRPGQTGIGKLAKTREYFANYIMMQNHHVKQAGCNQGFYRCLSPGTVLDISISMHPWRTKHDKSSPKLIR